MTSNQANTFLGQAGLSALLGELEGQRKHAVAWIGKLSLAAILCGAGTIGILQLNRAELGWSIGAGVVAFLVWAILTGRSYGNFVSSYKQQVMPLLLESIGSGFYYNPAGSIDVDEFEVSGLYRRPDRFKGQDYVSGQLDKTAFRFSLVHAEEEIETTTTDSDGETTTETRYDTIFRGLFFSADFNKHFSGHTRVQAGGTGILSGLRSGLVKLEDPEFSRSFTVTSNDQVEARYILSPALMRRLLDLRNRFDSKVQAAFVGSRVMLAVPARMNLLQPRFFRRADDPEVVMGYLGFLQNAIGLVEDLNLNTRIWTKQ
jgi:hypothetical protein